VQESDINGPFLGRCGGGPKKKGKKKSLGSDGKLPEGRREIKVKGRRQGKQEVGKKGESTEKG